MTLPQIEFRNLYRDCRIDIGTFYVVQLRAHENATGRMVIFTFYVPRVLLESFLCCSRRVLQVQAQYIVVLGPTFYFCKYIHRQTLLCNA